MYVTPEQIASANKANFEAMLSVATTQLSAFQKLANLQTTAVKSAFEDSITNTRALIGAKDMQEFVALQQSFAQPTLEKAVAYTKNVYEVAQQTNAELSKLVESSVSELNQNFASLFEKATESAPAGSDVAIAAFKSMLSAANSAYDSFNKAAKQAAEIAEANVTAAAETVKGFASAKKAA